MKSEKELSSYSTTSIFGLRIIKSKKFLVNQKEVESKKIKKMSKKDMQAKLLEITQASSKEQ